MPKRQREITKKERDFIENHYLKMYHQLISEKIKLETDIIESSKHSEAYVELARTEGARSSDVEIKVDMLEKNARLSWLNRIITAIDMTYQVCDPLQQRFIDMYYFNRKRYSVAAIQDAIGGRSWRTIGRWRYKICKMVMRKAGMLPP